ncbi:hypothetical protein BD769DRAFT_1391601 [Suillus cothurnatus]|nr:hypothetical protein BD769DRAFT_1391601 [Suillus cothurnatus]
MVEPDFPEKIIFLSYVFSEHINRLEMVPECPEPTSHDLPGLQGHFSRGLLNILNTMVEPDFPEKIAFLSYAGFFKCRNRLGMVPEHLEVDGAHQRYTKWSFQRRPFVRRYVSACILPISVDTLTQEETETLCGLYYVGTGRGDQTTTLSWWPTPTLWSASGLDVGYWTHSAEKMFQSRFTAIREGRAKLLTTRKWKGELNFYKNQTRKFIAAVEKQCVTLL